MSYPTLLSGLVMEKVWENASPSSGFDPQLITWQPVYTGAMYMIVYYVAPEGNVNNRAGNRATVVTRSFTEGLLNGSAYANHWRNFIIGYGKAFFNHGFNGTSSNVNSAVPQAIYEIVAEYPGRVKR